MSTETVTPTEQTPVAEKKFAVFRDNHRVSSTEYDSAKEAQHELSYWQCILKRWPDGTHLSIRELKWRRKEKETPANGDKGPDAVVVPDESDKVEQTSP